MEEELNSVEEEVTPHDSESTIVEQHDPEEFSEVQERHELEDKQEKNWRELRRKAEEAEAKSRMQEEIIKSFLEAQKAEAHPSTPAPEVDEFADISPDDFLTRSQMEKAIEKRAELIAERKYQEFEAKKEQSRFLERLKSTYSDFQDIVNPETIAIFEKKEPELARTIAELKDPYKMGLQSYKFIKALNLVSDADESRHAREVEKKLEKNEKSVQSPQVYNKRPMAKAFSISNMSSQEKKELYEEMMGHATKSGFSY